MSNQTNINLAQLFGDKVFRIPDYQRGYAWGERQLNELWEDIEDINIDANGQYRKHYTGAISLKPIDNGALESDERWLKENGSEFFDVVDGQQRLTTIVILLFELIKQLPENMKEPLRQKYIYRTSFDGVKAYIFSYKKTDTNYQYLRKEILEDTSIVLSDDKPNSYKKNLRCAKDFFCGKINALNEEQRKMLLTKLQTSLVVDTKVIDADLDVQAVFETMNNRGKQLTTLEKLKNRLLYLVSKLDVTEPKRQVIAETVNNSWRIIYDNLGKNPDCVLSEDEFLSAHLTLIRKPAYYSFSEQVAEDKVFQMFCNRSQSYTKDCYREGKVPANPEMEEPVSAEKISAYAIDIASYAPNWYNTCLPSDERIKKILCLNSSKEMKLFLAYVLSLCKDKYDDVEKCLNLIVRTVFRDSVLGLSLMDERTFATKAYDLHNGELTLEKINEDLENNLKTECNVSSMKTQFRNLFTYQRGGIGYHRWSGLKFFLFEYEEKLRIEKKEPVSKVSWNNFYDTTIEHVLPQNYSANWLNEMADYFKSASIPAEKDKEWRASVVLINTLGNLTILIDSKNSSLKDDGWKDKKSRYATGSLNEIAISQNTTWDMNTIYERGLDMLSKLEEMLGTLHLSAEDKKELLFDSHEFYFRGLSQQNDEY